MAFSETVCGHLTLALRLQGYTEVEEGLDRVWIESQGLLETVYGRLESGLVPVKPRPG